MAFTEIEFPFSDQEKKEILSAILEENGFHGFEETEHSLKAFTENPVDKKMIEAILKPYPVFNEIDFTINPVPNKNWNAVWEKSFKPVLIGNRVYVRSSFHEPNEKAEYEIIIDPKMSFGTGHHDTTALMMEMMLDIDLQGKSVLDFGSGTGILSILAQKMHADKITAIDNDECAYENLRENIQLNHAENIDPILGDQNDVPDLKYDLLLANVNKNIIVNCMEILACKTKLNAPFILGGLLIADQKEVLKKASQFGLSLAERKMRNEWICLKLNKVSR